MESFISYIPMDRRQALARGITLPDYAEGAALFADVSGFTALTEALVRTIGAQRGAEELPRQLNRVYDALIAEVHRYGGSVVGFSGDAITCWFDQSLARWHADASPPVNATPQARAVTCALALQRAMEQFASIDIPGTSSVSLSIKVSVASGSVRRYLVGDPAIQTIDALVGITLDRLAAGEQVSQRGEVLLDARTADILHEQLQIVEWRMHEEQTERYAVIAGMDPWVAPTPWPPLAADAISAAQARPWLLPPVYEHLASGLGDFLTELRPTTALFIRFSGIDYDDDELAQLKLDAYILWVQRILRSYDSYLLQLTIGDKGSYLYASFGAPITHEDNAVRAALAAIDLRKPPLDYMQGVQIGISQGRTRVGAYGALVRRTYGVLGDDVNLAARLMQNAPAGQVLVSQEVRQAAGERFAWEPLPPLKVKGKAQPVQTYRLIGIQHRRTIRLNEPRYALPMVGRSREIAFIGQQIDQILTGHGQIVGIIAEAGLGKSRLVAEAIRLAEGRGLIAYGGECQSYGTNTSYLIWQNIWRSFFDLDPAWTLEEQVAALKQALARIDPALLPRLPLLGAVLNLPIPDNQLTRDFDPRLRKASLEGLLISCLRIRATTTPLLLVLEDCHWLDPLSHELLEAIGRAIVDMPVLLLVAHRPAHLHRQQGLRVAQMPHFHALILENLVAEEVEQLVRLKLEQLFTAPEDVPDELVTQINERAQGNPFYIEELLNYLRDHGFDLCNPADLNRIELPPSLHSLILSRIDRLSENQKTLLKLASVIGRLFYSAILWGVSQFLENQAHLQRELDVLQRMELTTLHLPEPELAYLFKHVITQEVAYESLPFATRAILHEQIGKCIELAYGDQRDRYIDLLAFHYDRSENLAKRREYLLKAGEAAQERYANSAAINYYQRLLTILPAAEQGEALLRLGQVLELVGNWEEAHARYQAALAIAEHTGEQSTQARTYALIGELLRKQGNYSAAQEWHERARALFTALNDQAGLAQALHYAGSLAMHQGDYAVACEQYEVSLKIRRELGDMPMVGSVLSNLGIVAYHEGDVARAWRLFEESLTIRRTVGNQLWIANSLGNLGMLAIDQADYPRARTYIEESLALERATGERSAIAISLNNLGKVLSAQGDYSRARSIYTESLLINRELGDRWALTYLLEDIGVLATRLDQPERALRLVGAAEALRSAIGAPLSPREQASLDADLAPARNALSVAVQEVALATGRAMDDNQAIDDALQM